MPELRCWPTCVAYITAYRWRDRFVEVVAPYGEVGPDRSVEPGFYWLVKPCGWEPEPGVIRQRPDGAFAFPDHLLRPILPRPGDNGARADTPARVAVEA
jgi:hypothetical protein